MKSYAKLYIHILKILIVLNNQQINYKFNRQMVAWWFLFLMT